MNYVMTNYAGDVLTFQPPGENHYGSSLARFTRNVKRKVTSARSDYLDTKGQGFFIGA